MIVFQHVGAAWNCKVVEGKKQLHMYYIRLGIWKPKSIRDGPFAQASP